MNPNRIELARVLLDLGRAGVELAPHPTDPARLRHRPATVATDLAEALRRHRGAILGLLAGEQAHDAGDAGYVYSERLGIADGLGMPTHPGAPAWLVAVGESIESSCHAATNPVDCGHGSTHKGNSGGGEGERRDAIRDRQRCGRGP